MMAINHSQSKAPAHYHQVTVVRHATKKTGLIQMTVANTKL